jgi:two-component system sensor histidine kinase QseC
MFKLSDIRRPSLTLQILLGVAVPFLIVTALIGFIAYASALDEISEVYDSQLITTSQELWQLARSDDDLETISVGAHDLGLDREDQHALDDYARWRSFRVWRQGQLVIASDNAPALSVPVGAKGFRDDERNGAKWRIFTLIEPRDNIVVEVSEKLRARREVSERVVWGVSLPLLLILPIIGLAVWFGIRWGLRDLRGFATAVRQRSFDDLSRIPTDRTPRELAPLSESLNHLLGKLERSLAQERLFTDNAAHELRTPLAALGVQVAVARNAKTPDERDAMLDDLGHGVERSSRLLDQLLTLARIRHIPADSQPVNLYQAASETIQAAYAKARTKSVELSLSGAEDAVISVRRPLLDLLIGNLVDNAIKYSPAGGEVAVTIAKAQGIYILTLRDHGPGIPSSERENVFTRFYRVKGNTEPGSGLGLSIVRSISEILAVDIRLFTPADNEGLGVELRFKA